MNNSISNTLFRFVSLRSVQLLDSLVFPYLYVHVPGTIAGQGVFYEVIQKCPVSATKCETMLKVFDYFKEVIPTSILIGKR
ncbi:hypothetical protein [Myroides odoratus]|uniref:hypothetical protein n=1 Tax=Myroides odoratus TaxID=256 RepID=UPI00333E774E